MANYVQSNNSVGSSYQQFFLSKVPIGDDYIIFSTDEDYICVYGEYTGTNFLNSTVIKISRTYGSQGSVTYTNEDSTSFSISYEFYSYSNIGTGTILSSPQDLNNSYQVSNYIFVCLFVFVLMFLGFNVIKKRWIRYWNKNRIHKK